MFEINLGYFVGVLVAAYTLNVIFARIRHRDVTWDRFLLRAPIVALFATLVFGYLTPMLGIYGGTVAVLCMAWYDVTPGKLRGVHT